MFKSITILSHALGLLITAACGASEAPKPNIVYILADDLGYGDVRLLNPQGKIPTPQMDRMGAAGKIFTDAHSSSSVCTPSRYSILTGRYNWRSAMKFGVLNGFSPRLIEPNRQTVADFLKENGYHTACIGKWHLGMNWPQNDGKAPGASANRETVVYDQPVPGGPTSVGFDRFFGISASLDMLPFVYLDQDRVVEPPSVIKEWLSKGPSAAGFDGTDVLPTLTARAVEYIRQQGPAAKQGKPFFLYLPLTSPHTPILPTPDWQEKSGINKYADFVMQTDASVGAILDAVAAAGIENDTLIILTSDNGCSGSANFATLLEKGHNPNFKFRGSKSDIFEGGHRIPFLVKWPAKIPPGTQSDQLMCQSDLFATCAEILGKRLPENVAEDSVSMLPALIGKPEKPLREAMVHSAIFGAMAIREGNWILIFARDSGGWSDPKPGSAEALELPPVQLYDLAKDIGETNNLESQHPEVVTRLTALMEKYIKEGRSTPGVTQANTGDVELYSTRTEKKPPGKAPK